ncbi:MAG: hypothetical protein QM703_28690 [Gemmatales bacterium]
MRLTLAPTLDDLMNELATLFWSAGDTGTGSVWRSRHAAWESAFGQARVVEEVQVTVN